MKEGGGTKVEQRTSGLWPGEILTAASRQGASAMAKMIRGDQIVSKKDFTWRRQVASQWILVAVGGLVAVVGLMLVGHLTSQAIDPRWARDQSPAEASTFAVYTITCAITFS